MIKRIFAIFIFSLQISSAFAASTCPVGKVVTSASELAAALKAAQPGSVINLVKGVYVGPFEVNQSGTTAQPIVLCGPADAIIDGYSKSRIFHLNGASYWELSGFQLRNGNKGLGLTRANHNKVIGLSIHDTRGASVHVNSFSSDNVFDGLSLSSSGAEGFYVGSAKGNWCFYSDCKPDTSDRNVIKNCKIESTDDEAIDLKEGTTGGQVINNHMDGSRTALNKGWLNAKGNNYLISGNTGVSSHTDGFGVHKILAGWGNNNTFVGNSATVNGAGYGFYVQGGTTGNVIACNQSVVGAQYGFSNVACKY